MVRLDTVLIRSSSLERRSRDAMKAPVKAGRELRMQEPYRKGVANHLDPESCADADRL